MDESRRELVGDYLQNRVNNMKSYILKSKPSKNSNDRDNCNKPVCSKSMKT